jgi:hypothetical protein
MEGKMKKRVAGLLYMGGVLGSLLMGAQAALAVPPSADTASRPYDPYGCYWCDGSGCWPMTCTPY